MEKKKRTDNIYCITVAKYATMWVEADSEDEAVKYAKKYCDEVDDDEFWGSGTEVDSWETGAYQADEDMKKIWVEDGVTMTYDEYMDELEDGAWDEVRQCIK